MPWIWAALMPHPPIIIPAVGKGREKEASLTLDGTNSLRALLKGSSVDNTPDVLFVLSPHHHYAPGALLLNLAPKCNGSLASFGAPGASVSLQTPLPALAELQKVLAEAKIPATGGVMENISPDHGSIVPLLGIAPGFLEGRLPPVIIGDISGLAPDRAFALGIALRNLSDKRRWALLASGDLSHHLRADGPYGFNPAGPLFDEAALLALKMGSPEPLTALTQRTIDDAGECGLRAILVLLGLAQEPVEVLSYEGPLGVGYCNAFWAPGMKKTKKTTEDIIHSVGQNEDHPYVRLARQAIAARLVEGQVLTRSDIAALSSDESIWRIQRGCFVSIKNKDGSLRGCIGTFLPSHDNLGAEIIANAISASTADPRFAPMRLQELANVRISVDVLDQPEKVDKGMELDPARYGVIVVKNGRRGLLLPDLEGVDTVEKQIGIAADKAGISDLEGADIYRFTVHRYTESSVKH